MSGCDFCSMELEPTNITGVCAECKHIERDRRRGYIADEVPIEVARANFMEVFGGHYRPVSADAVYMPGACAKCARFRARHDTGRCEWCSRPWRPRASKRTRKIAHPKVQTSAQDTPVSVPAPQGLPPSATAAGPTSSS
jgi:hypothetical protein